MQNRQTLSEQKPEQGGLTEVVAGIILSSISKVLIGHLLPLTEKVHPYSDDYKSVL